MKEFTMAQKNKQTKQPTHEEITALARSFYEQEGCPQGRDLEHWHQAEAILKAKLQGEIKNAGKQLKSLSDLPSSKS